MKHKIGKVTLTILSSVLIFISGLYLWGTIFELILPHVEGAYYQTIDFGGSFRSGLLFSLVLSLSPLLISLIWRFAPIISTNKKLMCIGIVIVMMAMGIFLRRQMIIGAIEDIKRYSPNGSVVISSDEVSFHLYLLAGLIAGCIIAFLTLKQKKVSSSTDLKHH